MLLSFRVNNCVGYSNYKYFVLFLLYTVLLCAWFAVTGFYDFLRAWVNLLTLLSIDMFHSLTPHYRTRLLILPLLTSLMSFSVSLCAHCLDCPLGRFCLFMSTSLCLIVQL